MLTRFLKNTGWMLYEFLSLNSGRIFLINILGEHVTHYYLDIYVQYSNYDAWHNLWAYINDVNDKVAIADDNIVWGKIAGTLVVPSSRFSVSLHFGRNILPQHNQRIIILRWGDIDFRMRCCLLCMNLVLRIFLHNWKILHTTFKILQCVTMHPVL
jgi:hypothetical protein